MISEDAPPQKPSTEKKPDRARNDSVHAELEELREQIKILKSSKAVEVEDSSNSQDQNEPAPMIQKEKNVTSSDAGTELSTQVRELVEGLNKELKDANPITLIAVFAAGILVGRLLSK